MEFRRLLYFLAFLAVLTMAMRVSTASDTFWHLRAGEWILDHGEILREDPFSLTRFGEPWWYPGWLSQILLASAFHLYGFPALNILTSLFVLIGFIFIFQVMEGNDAVRVSVMLLTAVTSAVYWSARPHIITFALTGLFLWVLETYRQKGRNLLWILPIGMALWGNIHGGFAVGFILLFCYLVGEAIETLLAVVLQKATLSAAIAKHRDALVHYTIIGLISAAALSLNPYGPRMLLYPFMTVGIESLRDYIQEWQSPNFHDAQVYPFAVSILLLWLAFAISKRRIVAHEYLTSATFFVLALTAARNIALYALVVAPVLSRHLSSGLEPILGRLKSKREFRPSLARKLNLTLFVLCVIAAGVKISVPLDNAVNTQALRDLFPYDAVQFLRSREPEGPIFNSYNWGAYILWELYPDYRTFVDGRTDLFDDEILKSYLATWRGEPEWREVFDRWNIHLVFVEPNAPLRDQLELNGWKSIYVDDQAIILVP
jgi:hypothetical protein